MKNTLLFILFIMGFFIACQKTSIEDGDTTDLIVIDSLTATFNTVKAWDTTTIACYATGDSIIFSWECDHGNFNGEGQNIRYAAGECCVGINTITCTAENNTGKVSEEIKIEVTSYYEN